MVTEVKPVHWPKIQFGIEVTELGMLTLVKLVHSKKA